MSTLFLASILGLIQAITEFLPVSSTGHLILAQRLFNFDSNIFNLSFDIILHFGTLAALVFFFRKDLKRLMASIFQKNQDKRLSLGLVLATIPAGLAGLLFSNLIETNLRGVGVVALMLIVVGIVFIVIENISKKNKTLDDLSYRDAFLIGSAQALALIPGVSRSGITITVGLFLGFKRDESARFAFLLSMPIIFLASIKDLYDLIKFDKSVLHLDVYLVGFVVSAIASFFVIKFLLDYLKKHTLKPFAYYRFILAFIVLLLFI